MKTKPKTHTCAQTSSLFHRYVLIVNIFNATVLALAHQGIFSAETAMKN